MHQRYGIEAKKNRILRGCKGAIFYGLVIVKEDSPLPHEMAVKKKKRRVAI